MALLESEMSPVVKRKREERKAQIEIARQKEEERLRIEEPHNTIPGSSKVQRRANVSRR